MSIKQRQKRNQVTSGEDTQLLEKTRQLEEKIETLRGGLTFSSWWFKNS